MTHSFTCVRWLCFIFINIIVQGIWSSTSRTCRIGTRHRRSMDHGVESWSQLVRCPEWKQFRHVLLQGPRSGSNWQYQRLFVGAATTAIEWWRRSRRIMGIQLGPRLCDTDDYHYIGVRVIAGTSRSLSYSNISSCNLDAIVVGYCFGWQL